MVKNPATVQETQVWSLGQEDPWEREMATHSSIPAWEIPWTEEPGGLQSMGLQRIGHNWVTHTEHWAANPGWSYIEILSLSHLQRPPHCWPRLAASQGLSSPWPGIEPEPLAVKTRSPSPETAQEFPTKTFFFNRVSVTGLGGHHPIHYRW